MIRLSKLFVLGLTLLIPCLAQAQGGPYSAFGPIIENETASVGRATSFWGLARNKAILSRDSGEKPTVKSAWTIGLSLASVPDALRYHLSELKNTKGGAIIAAVEANSSAERVGLKVNDVVLAINSNSANPDDFQESIQRSCGTSLQVVVLAQGERRIINVSPHLRPVCKGDVDHNFVGEDFYHGGAHVYGIVTSSATLFPKHRAADGPTIFAGPQHRIHIETSSNITTLDAQWIGNDGHPERIAYSGTHEGLTRMLSTVPLRLKERLQYQITGRYTYAAFD